MPRDQKSAVAAVLADAAARHKLKSEQTMAQLAAEYTRTKLAVLDEKVALLRGVEGMFDAERGRLDAEKRDLQILRAQLALAQQSFVEAAPTL